MSSAKSEEICSYVFLSSLITKSVLDATVIFPLFLNPHVSLPPPSFILSFLFISTFHVHARRSVWILVPSALPISPYVVAVRLKSTVQAHLHINATRELAAVHLMRRQQLSPKIFWDSSLSNIFIMLVRSNWIFEVVTLIDKPSLRTSTSSGRGHFHPQYTLLSYYDQIPPFYSSTQSLLTKTSPPREDPCLRLGPQAQYTGR